eukprot:TRINITY_DN3313_c0_g1_i1.p1 TRINITY_DN3313_c0_g1~~TRINITY_DN3313_c0_g1_i1.p1  ORF type:complete len:263 (-),score=67.64 TRINITY_DN3313_c0_g1_i1:41-829(-)
MRFIHYFQYIGPLASSALMEFMGTFFLVLVIGLVAPAPPGTIPLAPIAIGSMLMVMIFMGGHISGAHYNPAVTVGVRLTGRSHITLAKTVIYLIVQVAAGVLAAGIAYRLNDVTVSAFYLENKSMGKAFTVEFLFTFALVSVMLNCATTKSQMSNSFFGLAIGWTVVSSAISVGGISGGAFNPAVSTSFMIIDALIHGASRLRMIWLYWLAQLLGSLFAAIVFRVTNTSEYRHQAAMADGIAKDKETGEGYIPVNNSLVDEE